MSDGEWDADDEALLAQQLSRTEALLGAPACASLRAATLSLEHCADAPFVAATAAQLIRSGVGTLLVAPNDAEATRAAAVRLSGAATRIVSADSDADTLQPAAALVVGHAPVDAAAIVASLVQRGVPTVCVPRGAAAVCADASSLRLESPSRLACQAYC